MDRIGFAHPLQHQETSQSWLTTTRWTVGAIIFGVPSLIMMTPRLMQWLRGFFPSKKQDAKSTDPGLLRKGTTFERYETPSGHVYPKIRTFYHPHSRFRKLPNDIPLVVFMHGLGGSAAQFAPLLTSLVNIAPCLAIDLPGCGLSDFQPANESKAFMVPAFAELLYCAIDRFRQHEVDQKVILIGHSLGCSISALLASSSSPLAHLCSRDILGMVTICPRSSPLSAHELHSLQRVNWVPSLVFDLIRSIDRWGGLDSASVLRMVGKDADPETRKLQLRYNVQSKSAVFQKFCYGLYLLESTTAEKGEQSLLGKRVWAGIKKPLFLIAAESDPLAPPKEVEQIAAWLSERNAVSESQSGIVGDTSLPDQGRDEPFDSKQTDAPVVTEVSRPSKHDAVLKTTIFPAPASHGLLYSTGDIRILSGLIENFNGKHLDERLSPGWQLQHLTTSGKWDVKNLEKWKSVAPCSEPIGGVFRAMKTMREVDDSHCPVEFVKRFGYQTLADGVAIVVDISHESPVYDKNGLENGGVEYHKFPTVSKLPPTADEVEHFLALIDRLREEPVFQKQREGRGPTIGVHCHYGFNRTGFFIICYLVERLGYKLQQAVDEFAEKRPPGIKHDYFVNELFVRYAVKMERRGTLVTPTNFAEANANLEQRDP